MFLFNFLPIGQAQAQTAGVCNIQLLYFTYNTDFASQKNRDSENEKLFKLYTPGENIYMYKGERLRLRARIENNNYPVRHVRFVALNPDLIKVGPNNSGVLEKDPATGLFDLLDQYSVNASGGYRFKDLTNAPYQFDFTHDNAGTETIGQIRVLTKLLDGTAWDEVNHNCNVVFSYTASDKPQLSCNQQCEVDSQCSPGLACLSEGNVSFCRNPQYPTSQTCDGVILKPSPSPNVCASTGDWRDADINQDLIVNIQDFSMLQNEFGKTPPDNCRIDINRDGTVNIQDFSILQNNFGKSGTVPSPTSSPIMNEPEPSGISNQPPGEEM